MGGMSNQSTIIDSVELSKVPADDSSSRGLRLHNSLWEVVEAVAAERGISKTKLIRDAVIASLVQAQ
jgi:predicted DNA-binding ribbon-helix-helix protein